MFTSFIQCLLDEFLKILLEHLTSAVSKKAVRYLEMVRLMLVSRYILPSYKCLQLIQEV